MDLTRLTDVVTSWLLPIHYLYIDYEIWDRASAKGGNIADPEEYTWIHFHME